MDMDNLLQDKDSQIRLTIRKYILPLIHAIYDEDPEDVILYCFGYFEGLLQEREFKNNGDNSSDHLKTSNYMDNKEQISKEQTSESEDASRSNLQGSASDPVLTKDIQDAGLSVRETSSWDTASSHSSSTVPRNVLKSNLADAMSKIGDQPSSKVNLEEAPERDVQAGDANVKKEKGLVDDNSIDNQMPTNVTSEQIDNNAEIIYGLPSAPSYYCFNEEEIPRSEETNRATLQSDVCDSSNIFFHPCTKDKMKELSPTSSFGFIPHLDRHNTKEETKENQFVPSDDFTGVEKTEEQLKDQAKKLSESFNPLAQEFHSAATNFNELISSARNINDVIPSRHQNYHLKKEDFEEESDQCLKMDMDNQNIERKRSRSPHKILTNTEDEIASGRNYSRNSSFTEQQSANNLLKSRNPKKVENLHSYEDLGKEELDVTKIVQSDADKNNVKSDRFESRQIIDESWRKRWYEAHSNPNNINEGIRLRALLRGNRELLTFGNYSNKSIYNIGEAGDIPSARSCVAEDPPYESLNSPQEINQNNSNLSLVERKISSSSFSSNESTAGITTEKSNRNYTNVSSQSIPYSWRQICRKQAPSTEGEAKQFQKAKENESNLNENKHELQKFESPSEVTLGKERDKIDNSLGDECSEAICKGLEQCQIQEQPEKNDFKNKELVNEENPKNEKKQDESVYSVLNTLNETRENFHEQNVLFHDRDRVERVQSSSYLHQSEENVNLDTKMIDGFSSQVRQYGKESRVYGPEKVEPGLNSACGDFVPIRNDMLQEQEVSIQPSEEEASTEENAAGNTQPPFGCITEDCLEEIIEKVAEELDDFKDSYETIDCLTSSGSESDFSAADEVNINEQ